MNTQKHPLETALEQLIEAKNAQGRAPVANWKTAETALAEWRLQPKEEPPKSSDETSEKDKELNDLRALKEAVRKALTWGPPSSSEPFRPEPAQPSNWRRAEPVRPSIASAVAAAIMSSRPPEEGPRIVAAQRVPVTPTSPAP